MRELQVELFFSLLGFGFGRGFSARFEGLTGEPF